MKQGTLQYLSIADVAQETRLSKGFWRKAILYRRIPYAKLGRRVVIRRRDLDAWVAARMVAASADIQTTESINGLIESGKRGATSHA